MEEKDIITEEQTEQRPPEDGTPAEAKERERLPRWSKVLYIIAGVAALVLVIAIISPAFADFYNRYFGSVVRGTLAHATGWIPFSLAEGLILLAPVLAVAVIVWANRPLPQRTAIS